MPFKFYFFSGTQYIRVTREDTGPGTVDPGYPRSITEWGWPGNFGSGGIDAALYSGSKCYFFKGSEYVRVTRGTEGPGSQDFTEPHPISEWGWPDNFGANGIDAALWSGPVTYFFSMTGYITVVRGDEDFGTVVQSGRFKVRNIRDWLFPLPFGERGIKGAMYSGEVCYFFDGNKYIRVHRGIYEPGYLDAGYPRFISEVWGWKDGFGAGANGIDAALYSGGDLVPISPLAGLPVGTNSLPTDWNYFLWDNGRPLTGLTAVINIDEDLTIDFGSGMGFQLNCYSAPEPHKTDLWQQFVFQFLPPTGEVWATINNWSGAALNDEVIAVSEFLFPLSNVGVVPAGYVFEIQVNNNTENNITGATFSVYNNKNNRNIPIASQPILIVGQTWQPSGFPATVADLVPIIAMTFNIVSGGDGATAVLTGASGSVTFSASNTLTAINSEPPPLTFMEGEQETAENSNVIFAQLPQTANTSITQIFDIQPGTGFGVDAIVPTHRRKFRPFPRPRTQ